MIRHGHALPALIVLALTGVLTTSTAVALGGSAPAEVTIGGCPVARGSPPRPEHLRRPPQTITRSDRLIAIVKTNCGRFRIRLDARRAPITVNSLVYLARSGFYRGLDFYRVVPDFLIEAGDPREEGIGGPGYSTTEPPPRHFHFHLGAVAMAKTLVDPRGRAGSVFFVVVDPCDLLAASLTATRFSWRAILLSCLVFLARPPCPHKPAFFNDLSIGRPNRTG